MGSVRTLSSRTTFRLHHRVVTTNAFLADLAAAAHRLGYPLDNEARRLLAMALDSSADEWQADGDKRAQTMTRLKKTVLCAVTLALNSGASTVDARMMAVALADQEHVAA